MNGVEFIVIECLKQKKWENALHYLDQLLEKDDDFRMENEKLLAYLLWRTQCYFELEQYEACIKDCRKIIDLVPTVAPRDNFWFKARWRLAHSLIKNKSFEEAEFIVQQLIDLCSDFTKQECIKLLERIKICSKLVNSKAEGKAINNENSICTFIKENFKDKLTDANHKSKERMKTSQDNDLFCVFCNMLLENSNDFRIHCSTQSHQQIIMSDEGRDWKKRPPPRGLTADTYNLCPLYGISTVGYCKNGAQCVDAHGIEELNEWKERFEYRMMRLQRANEAFFYGKSYTELLLNRLSETSNPEVIMRETIDDVEEDIDGELTAVVDSKICDKQWVFTLLSKKVLKVVALLYDSHRNHFSLKRIMTLTTSKKKLLDDEPINPQEWTSRLDSEKEQETLVHRVEVAFSTKLYGTFRQSVLFDFGSEPVLVKHICVDVVPVKDAEKIKEMQQELVLSSTERWEKSNANIIPFVSSIIENSYSDREKELLAKYAVPTGHKFTITQSMLHDDHATMNNYRSRMHELLYIEEMACFEQVSKYSVRASVQIVNSYILSASLFGASTAKFATSNELFAVITLSEDVSDDSPGGRLVLNNCTTVLLADEKKIRKSKNLKKPKVYEALIEDKGKNTVYLRLSNQMVTDMKLKPDTSKTLEMQFQLNRIPFCEWHQAVDCISNYRIIFPDLLRVPVIPDIDDIKWSEENSKLNDKQKEAIAAITFTRETPLPPVLIIGPFGTGKTYTLAQAIKHILLEKDTRILICTHSNSAADLYIKEYLHPYVQAGLKEATPLRVYYHKRWVSTVSSTVLEYCLTEVKNGTKIFRIPTLNDILRHRIIVVTLNISSHLSTIGLPKGYFTHILLDEAAQAIECEAIMPLALANEKTRIVLAGDHMQLSPEVFSSFARQKKFHVSLLQRLYESYPSNYPFKIILCENYRAHKAIVQFTSNLFYDNKLISVGGQPKHRKFYPLTFFTALGEDVQEKYSTGFYNCAEVYELVERVIELKNDWPESWGKFNESSIGIMSPYPDQVYRIRIELKKRKMFGIAVERVLNVQGKQFRAVFLSTVRTARTCITGDIDSENESTLDFGFLSNKKLLNTAVTRAQSLVAVVGDPVSLCSLGRCRKIWEMFIETCSKNNSFYGLTWQDLKSLLLAVELKKKYKLNPLAPEFIPRCLHLEPYLQIGASSSQPPPGVYPFMDNNVGPCSINGLSNGRVFTYDNIRYQLPQKPAVVTPPVLQQPVLPPSVPSSVSWNTPVSAIPIIDPLTLKRVNPNNFSNISVKPAPTQPPIRAPPGFPPLQVRSNPIVHPQTANPSFSNVFQPITQFPQNPTFVPPVRNPVSETIPLHLTLIPLSQYMRSHPPPAYSISSTNKTFNPSLANFGNPVYGPPVNIQNGFKPVINTPNVPNEVSYIQEYTPYVTNAGTNSVASNVNSQAEHELMKSILPPNVSIQEVVRNTVLQKQWLSHLVDSKQIQQAQMFLNLIGTYTAKENVQPPTASRRIVRTGDNMEIMNNEVYHQNLTGNTMGNFHLADSSLINGDKPNTVSKDYEPPNETAIPLDIHLPSSLISDILPSSGKRAGPLYSRQPSKTNNTMKIDNDFSANKTLGAISEHFSKNVSTRDVSTDNFTNSFVEKSHCRIENGDLESRKTAFNEYNVGKGLNERCSEIPSKQVFSGFHSNAWNLLPYSLQSDGSKLNDANAMTYAAALRQTQEKLPERSVNDKSYFNYN